MTALLPSLVLPTGSSSIPVIPTASSSKWSPADPPMPASFVQLANSSFEEEHFEIGMETLASFCSGEFAPSVSHLLILLHLALSSRDSTVQQSSLRLLSLLSTLNSPRSLLLAVPPNSTGSRFDDERDISHVEQLSRWIIRWKSWADGLIGDNPGQVRAPRKEGGNGDGGWDIEMGRRAKGKGRARERKVEGRGRKEEEVIVEEENWWKVTRILVGLWERDLREVREWEGEGESPLPMFLSQLPTDGSNNPRRPRSDIGSLVKAIFSAYPSVRPPKGAAFEDEEAVDFALIGEFRDEAEEDGMLGKRELAGRLMGMILTLSTPPTPYLSPARYFVHLFTPFAHLPTSHLPLFFSLIPSTTPPAAILVLLASVLGFEPNAASPTTPEAFVGKAMANGKKTLRNATVKVLMMGRLKWEGVGEMIKAKLRDGWREGLGFEAGVEGDPMDVERGQGWKWMEEIGAVVVAGLGN